MEGYVGVLMAVLTPPNIPKQFTDLAHEIAHEREETLIAPSEISTEDPIVVVAPPDNLDNSILRTLKQRSFKTEVGHQQYSIITGQTAESARNLYFNRSNTGTEHWMFFSRSDREWRSHDTDVTIFNESIPRSEIKKMSEDHLLSLSLFTASSSMHINLGNELLCSIPKNTSTEIFSGDQPYCIEDSSFTCPYDNDIIHADDLNISHIFLPSCCSVIPNEEHDSPAYIGLNLLECSSSLIGTDWDTLFYDQELPLYHALLRSGYKITTICEILNRSAASVKGRQSPYIPFGHPSVGLSRNPGTYNTTIENISDDTIVTIYDIDAPLIDIVIDDLPNSSEYYVWYDGDGTLDVPLYYLTFKEEENTRLLIYGWGWLKGDQLQVRISCTPRDYHKRKRIQRCKQNIQSTLDLNVCSNKVQGQSNDLYNKSRGLSHLERKERYDLRTYRDITERLDMIERDIENISERVFEDIEPADPHNPIGNYLKHISDENSVEDLVYCPYCDHSIQLQHVDDQWSTFSRAKGICPSCGDIFDIPYNAAEKSDLAFPILHIDKNSSDQIIPIDISFEGVGCEGCRVLTGIKLFTNIAFDPSDRDDVDGTTLLNPRYRWETITKNGTQRSEFELDKSDLYSNKYWIAGYVISDLEIYSGYRPLTVGNTAGHKSYNGI